MQSVAAPFDNALQQMPRSVEPAYNNLQPTYYSHPTPTGFYNQGMPPATEDYRAEAFYRFPTAMSFYDDIMDFNVDFPATPDPPTNSHCPTSQSVCNPDVSLKNAYFGAQPSGNNTSTVYNQAVNQTIHPNNPSTVYNQPVTQAVYPNNPATVYNQSLNEESQANNPATVNNQAVNHEFPVNNPSTVYNQPVTQAGMPGMPVYAPPPVSLCLRFSSVSDSPQLVSCVVFQQYQCFHLLPFSLCHR